MHSEIKKSIKIGTLENLVTWAVEYPQLINHINAVQDFGVMHGVGLRTRREGAVLSEPFAEGSEDIDMKKVRYLVSVDLDNEWQKRKEKTIFGRGPEPLDDKTKAKIMEKYGSVDNYRTELRKLLSEDFLDKFLPFLGNGPLTYTFQTSIFGAFPSNDSLIKNEYLWNHNSPSATVLRYMRGGHFYASEDMLTFKSEFNSWTTIPGIDLKLKDGKLEYELFSCSDVKFHSNIMIKFLSDPDSFEKFKTMLNLGPIGTSFAIGNNYLCARFFCSDDPVNQLVRKYLELHPGEEFYKHSEEGAIILGKIKDNLASRGMLYTDPSLMQRSVENILKVREIFESKKPGNANT